MYHIRLQIYKLIFILPPPSPTFFLPLHLNCIVSMMRIVIYLIGVFALAACSFRQPCAEELAGIARYIESCPDSAKAAGRIIIC